MIQGRHKWIRWACGVVLLVIDLTPLSVIYLTIMDGIKWKSRPLNPEEISVAKSIFGDGLPLHLITLDPVSFPVKQKRAAAYMSFHTINFYKTLQPQTLIHELVHIWQYKRHGSVYISEAMWAQHWGGGYDYGGLVPLQTYSEGGGLAPFNFEQQADIIEDYYRWRNGLPLQWAVNVPGIGELLEYYRNQLT